MEYTSYICTTCGFLTKNKPDDEGMVECEYCIAGLSAEERLSDGANGEGADR